MVSVQKSQMSGIDFPDETHLPEKLSAGFLSKSQSTAFDLYKDFLRLKLSICSVHRSPDRPKTPKIAISIIFVVIANLLFSKKRQFSAWKWAFSTEI